MLHLYFLLTAEKNDIRDRSWILTDKQRRENIGIFLMEIKWIFNSLFVTIYIIYQLLTYFLDFKAFAKVSWNHFHQNKSDCKVFWDRKLAFSWHIVFQWSMKYKIILKPRCSISIHNTRFTDRKKIYQWYINDVRRPLKNSLDKIHQRMEFIV